MSIYNYCDAYFEYLSIRVSIYNYSDAYFLLFSVNVFYFKGKYESSINDKSTVNSKQSIFDSLTAELETMIAKLTQINEQVSQRYESLIDFY